MLAIFFQTATGAVSRLLFCQFTTLSLSNGNGRVRPHWLQCSDDLRSFRHAGPARFGWRPRVSQRSAHRSVGPTCLRGWQRRRRQIRCVVDVDIVTLSPLWQMLQCNGSTPTRTREYGSTAEGRVWIACAMVHKKHVLMCKWPSHKNEPVGRKIRRPDRHAASQTDRPTDFAGWLDGWDRTAPAAWPLSLQACFTVNPPNCIYFKNLSSFYQCPLLLGKEQSHKLVGRIDRYVHNHRTILRLL